MTAQAAETLILDGQEVAMSFCPGFPEDHPRIAESRYVSGRYLHTGCWRQYRGTWEIRDDRLYLVSIAGKFRLRRGQPLFAEWFSGTLRICRGELLQYVHMGFGSVFEEELLIDVDQGVIVESRVQDNRGKVHDPFMLGIESLPGRENQFDGQKAELSEDERKHNRRLDSWARKWRRGRLRDGG